MKITFITNYYNHHQSELSNALDRLTNHSFTFVSTGKMRRERAEMGYGGWTEPEFVIDASESEHNKEMAKKKIEHSDVLIIGSAPDEFYLPFLSEDKIIFRYSERPFKKGIPYLKLPIYYFRWRRRFSGERKYLLSASAYTYLDYSMLGFFKEKAFKWGYFPQMTTYDLNKLFASKDKLKILWCGRLIGWKHPDSMIRLAERLRDSGRSFSIDIIGTGEMENQLCDMIKSKKLEDCVHLLGSMPPESVRKHMEEAGVFAFTSDYQEGWGVVLNEAMNSGCAVIASKAAGSAQFLIEDGVDGVLYSFDNEQILFEIAGRLLDEPQTQERLGRAAYKKIISEWNADIAAKRLLALIDVISDDAHKDLNLFESGPCSRC